MLDTPEKITEAITSEPYAFTSTPEYWANHHVEFHALATVVQVVSSTLEVSPAAVLTIMQMGAAMAAHRHRVEV